MELTEQEMYKVDGGVSWTVIGTVAGVLVYIIGVISGYTNPNRCNN